jgi:hypothetical protein
VHREWYEADVRARPARMLERRALVTAPHAARTLPQHYLSGISLIALFVGGLIIAAGLAYGIFFNKSFFEHRTWRLHFNRGNAVVRPSCELSAQRSMARSARPHKQSRRSLSGQRRSRKLLLCAYRGYYDNESRPYRKNPKARSATARTATARFWA